MSFLKHWIIVRNDVLVAFYNTDLPTICRGRQISYISSLWSRWNCFVLFYFQYKCTATRDRRQLSIFPVNSGVLLSWSSSPRYFHFVSSSSCKVCFCYSDERVNFSLANHLFKGWNTNFWLSLFSFLKCQVKLFMQPLQGIVFTLLPAGNCERLRHGR